MLLCCCFVRCCNCGGTLEPLDFDKSISIGTALLLPLETPVAALEAAELTAALPAAALGGRCERRCKKSGVLTPGYCCSINGIGDMPM